MPSIKEETAIAAPPDKVWPLLRDPETVARCIPGAELAPNTDGDTWRGSIRVKFGPTVASFRGEAALAFDDETRTCVIKGRGIDQRGASRALASGKMAVTGETETTLAVEGDFNVTGPLETFANAGGVHVAKALLAEFSKNLAEAAGGAAAPAEEAAPADEPAGDAAPEAPAPAAPMIDPQSEPVRAKEINGLALLWQIMKSMLAGLFGRKG